MKEKQYVYSNYKACKKCPNREDCCPGSHRSITRYGQNQAEALIEIEENKIKYKYRNIVEGPNGTYKIYYQINE